MIRGSTFTKTRAGKQFPRGFFAARLLGASSQFACVVFDRAGVREQEAEQQHALLVRQHIRRRQRQGSARNRSGYERSSG